MSLVPVTLRNATDTYVSESAASHNHCESSKLALDNTTNARRYAFVYFSRPFPLGATITSATLRLYSDASSGSWSATSRTITAERITSGWKASSATWTTQPTVTTTGAVAVTTTAAITDGAVWTFDLTAMMQLVSDGTPWYGVRLRISEAAYRRLHSAESSSGSGSLKPTLDVTYSQAPAAPAALFPSGGRAVTGAAPILRFAYNDASGSALQAVQVQVNSTSSFSGSVDFDSGTHYTSDAQYDLNLSNLPKNSNPTFDVDTTGWTATLNNTISRVTTPVQAGAGALRMSSTASGTMEAATPSGTGGFAVVGGQTYTASGWTRTAASARTATMLIDWYDTSGASVGTSTGTGSANSTSYAIRSVTGVAPTSAAFARVRLQVSSTGGAAELHYWDTVQVASGTAILYGVALGATAYWRARVQDVSGLWSPWSDVGSFVRTAKGSLTITNPAVSPNNFVTEATPPISWSLTGASQSSWQVIIQDSVGDQWLHTSGKITSAATAYTVPAGVINPATTYTVVVRVWDTVLRESVPNDPAYVEASRTFTYNATGATVVSGLTATDLTPEPGVTLQWNDTTAPDSYTILRDGKVIAAKVLPGDVFVSGTTYRVNDRGVWPRATHTWEVRRVVNGVTSTSNPTVTLSIGPVGIWLIDEVRNIRQQIMGADAGTWTMGEKADVYEPLGSSYVVRITQSLRGYEGTIVGTLAANAATGQTIAQATANMFTLKARAGAVYRLVLSDIAIPVIIGNVVVAPSPEPEIIKQVSFDFWQVGELPFTPVF